MKKKNHRLHIPEYWQPTEVVHQDLVYITEQHRFQSLWAREKEAWLLHQLGTNLDIIHVVLVLGVCKMKELWELETSHPNFRKRPNKPSNVPLKRQNMKL